MRVRVSIAWLVLGVTALVACGDTEASTRPTVDRAALPGPVRPGFEGQAYAVPSQPDPADPDAVPVTLRDRAGEVIGRDVVRAGRPWPVAVGSGPSSERVVIPWGDGVTAEAPRRDFWSVPEFMQLKDMTVRAGDRVTPLGVSGLDYHRGNIPLYDDKATPAFDGINTQTRGFLACQADKWGIGQQTMTVDLIEQGVHRQDRSLIDKGVIGLHWGVALPLNAKGIHELRRGCDGKTVPDYGYTHHATQWLESMARAVYLLAASEHAGSYQRTIASTLDRIELLASRLVQRDNWDHWTSQIEDGATGNDYTHRTFMMAAALGLASTLTDDTDDAELWAERAATVARRGLDNQWDNGVSPEKGGYDVQYQMYGTWLAQLYRSTLHPDSGLRDELTASIDRAIAWNATRIDERTGQIDIRGSRRICAEVLWTSGKKSAVFDPAETIRAFLLWGHLRSDQRLIDLAIVMDRGEKQRGNPCPPPS